MRVTDVLDTKGVLCLVQSVPSPKAEPFKMWLAEAMTMQIPQIEKPTDFETNRAVAREGGKMAKAARAAVEKRIGKSVVTSLNARRNIAFGQIELQWRISTERSKP